MWTRERKRKRRWGGGDGRDGIDGKLKGEGGRREEEGRERERSGEEGRWLGVGVCV